jgi:alkylation response protein AidB-like acyl-CoA dehydrogenase
VAFVPEPMLPGDLYEGAARLARAANEDLLRLTEPATRADALGRWWGEAVALGWPSLFVPEACGGAGGSLEDLSALVEGAASDALPLPVAAICGVLPTLFAAAQAERVVALMDARLCPVLVSYEGWASAAGRPLAERMDGAIRLTGSALGVEILEGVTGYLVAAPLESQPALLLVPAASLRQPLRRYERMDGRLSADLSFDGVELPADALLAHGPNVARQVAAALELGACLTCVEVVAGLGSAIERVISYLANRRQFGVALSSLQALRHKVAETYITYETIRAMVQHLLRMVARGGAAREVALAKLYIGRAARRAAETIIQLHGGMGMTQELPATRLNKRLMMAEFDYGDADWHAHQLLRAA